MTRRLLLVLLGVLAVLGVAAPAQAATTTVTLGQGGPNPATATVQSGDTVVFRNGDGVSHTLRSTSSNWSLNVVLRSGQSQAVPFSAPGTYDYSDSYSNILGIPQTSAGRVVVPSAATASPTPSATRRPTTAPRPTASARPTAAASATPAPSASASAGVAVPPPIVGAVVPTGSATPTTGPVPVVALPGASPTGSASGAPVAGSGYADPSTIVQHSPHGFGLPVALAVVAVVGVVSLLARFLLAAPEARPEARTDVG